MKIKCSSEKKSSKKVAEIISHFFLALALSEEHNFIRLKSFVKLLVGVFFYKIWRNQEKNLKDIRTIIEQGIIFI